MVQRPRRKRNSAAMRSDRRWRWRERITMMKNARRARSVAMLKKAVQVLTGSAIAKVQRSWPRDPKSDDEKELGGGGGGWGGEGVQFR